MKTILSRPPNRVRVKGFTLLELLVALAVSSILIVFLVSVTSTASIMSTNILGKLDAQTDTKTALDFLERDFVGLAATENSRTTLTILPETLTGRTDISSCWIMMLSRPLGDQGALKAVSYRLVYTDPMVAGGGNNRPVLFRSEAPTGSTYLDVADLHTAFWGTNWSGALDDYLAEGIVDIAVTVNYRDNAGDVYSTTLDAGSASNMNWTPAGFTGNTVAAPSSADTVPDPSSIDLTSQTPISITITMTSLRPQGLELYKIGALSKADAITQHGVTLSRTIPLNSGI